MHEYNTKKLWMNWKWNAEDYGNERNCCKIKYNVGVTYLNPHTI